MLNFKRKKHLIVVAVIFVIITLNGTVSANTTICPADFYHLPLLPEAKYCQVFDQELPASLTYFANVEQMNAKNFYLDSLGQPETIEVIKGRDVLRYLAGKHTVIISKDGSGSQIDILVKN